MVREEHHCSFQGHIRKFFLTDLYNGHAAAEFSPEGQSIFDKYDGNFLSKFM